MSKHAVKKLSYLLRLFLINIRFNKCDKTILENGGTLKSVPGCYKNQEMFNKTVDNYPHALEFVPECYKIDKMCDKAVNTHSSIIQFVPEYDSKNV